jgi:hypothetical protein
LRFSLRLAASGKCRWMSRRATYAWGTAPRR